MTREPSPSLTIAVDELLAWWDAPNSQRVPLDPIIAKIRAARSAPAILAGTEAPEAELKATPDPIRKDRDDLREENAKLRLEIGLLESREPKATSVCGATIEFADERAKLDGDRKQHCGEVPSMTKPSFIVAEMSTTWGDATDPLELISHALEKVISHNLARGYLLYSFSHSQVMVAPGQQQETIIAVFRHAPIRQVLPSVGGE